LGNPEKLVRVFKDGTVRHWNFFSGSEAWTVPGRGSRPGLPVWVTQEREKIPGEHRDRFCNFCPALYENTPPEKARLVKRGGGFETVRRIDPSQLHAGTAEFRRISNLFEISTFEYWRRNHGFSPEAEVRDWQASYLASKEGALHLRNMIRLKLLAMEWNENDIDALPAKKIEELTTPFFAGSHELIVARRHFVDEAEFTDERCSSADLTPEEHHAYLAFTLEALSEIRRLNPHVRMVHVFQNWLKPAGASFDHLHKQLVGTDCLGIAVEQKLAQCDKDPQTFKRFLETANREGLVIAANEHAAAIADTGQPHPAVIVVSSSLTAAPEEMPPDALTGLSDLVHACHGIFDRAVPANEEWFYTPPGISSRMPVHLVIKWRINRLAGFEGAAGVFINPIDPRSFRDSAVDRLRALQKNEKTRAFRTAEACSISSLLD
jgi:galactose-1-phosphate uridylyltransferase